MMTSELRPILRMSDVHPTGHAFVARAHERACEWLPNEPHLLDFMTGSPIAVGGDLPVVCSEGFNTDAGLDLLRQAGIEPARARIHFSAGGELEGLSHVAAVPGTKLVMQHAYPADALPAERYWIDPDLLRYLNNKANLGALCSAAHVPPRAVVNRESFFWRRAPTDPLVLKAATDQSSGGGCAVMICRSSADLDRAKVRFRSCDQIVVEQMLDIVHNPCLNFAVMSSGEARYLGHAEQDISESGRYQGNWMHLGSLLPEDVIEPAMEVVCRAGEMGYRGFAGVDVAVSRDDQIYVVDLNFRMNASTGSVLFAPALRERLGSVFMHLRKFTGPGSGEQLAQSLEPFVRSDRIIPLSFFDPRAAGYHGKRPMAQALIAGTSREEVLATERELASQGIE